MSSSHKDTDKSLLLNTFNTQLFEFIEDIQIVLSHDISNFSIKKVKMAFTMIKKTNPSLVIKIWNNYISAKYETEINNNNIDFFIEKDYKKDLIYLNSSDDIINNIYSLREPIRNMSKENQEKSLEYIKNLCILSKLYME